MTQPTDDVANRRFAPRTNQIPHARRFVRHALTSRGVAARVDDAVLMVSELVTNAILYGYGEIDAGVVTAPGRVRVEVTNASADHDTPHLVEPTPNAIGGRGLDIVDHLASLWGTERDNAGRTRVWFLRPALR